MRLSLRYRLLLPLALVLAATAGGSAWAAYTAAAAAERRVAGQLRAVARTLTEPPAFPLTHAVLDRMRGLSGAEFLFVRADGFRETTFPDPGTRPPTDVPAADPDDPAHPLGPPVTVGGRAYRCRRLELTAYPNAGGRLYVFYPESLRQTAVWDAARPPLLFGTAGGLAAVAVMAAIGGRLVRRIRGLEQRTRLIAGGDFRTRPVPPGGDELDDLLRSANEMAGRLAAYQEEQGRTERLRVLGQFAGGMAHQLLNAAAGAKLAVELFLAENPSADPEPLAVALRQLARIEGNLRQFLELGKPAAGARVACDLAALVGQSVAMLRPQCQHAGTALAWDPPAGRWAVVGDPTHLGHMLGNVIGNAVEAAGPGGSVEVRLTAAGGRFVVEVFDTGPGPPAELGEKLFDPFVTGKEGGTGLGLAVAKQAADAHGGRIGWERRGGRTVFRIELPGNA